VNNDMEHLNKGDYANGDPVEAVYYLRSKTFVYRARSKLVDEDAGEICMSLSQFHLDIYSSY
jgi:hypothetical protein